MGGGEDCWHGPVVGKASNSTATAMHKIQCRSMEPPVQHPRFRISTGMNETMRLHENTILDRLGGSVKLSTDLSKEGIDKWSNCRSLGQDNQASQKNEHHDDGKEPKFLPLLDEGPEFHHKIAHTPLLLTSTVQNWFFIWEWGLGDRRTL